jgi:tetratricopeptide (TPR) repeat protein
MGRLLSLLGGVLLLKVAVLLQLKDHPLTHPDAGLDTTAYARLAERVVAGDLGLGPGVYYVSPLYIYFLAAGLAVFESFTAVRVVQIVLGTASVGFIFFTARIWFGDRAAWLAAILAALTGLFTFYEVLILQASIDACLTSAALWCVASSFSRKGERAASPSSSVVSAFRRNHLALAGLIFGVQALNRPNMLIAVVGVAIVMLVARRIRPAALLVAGLLVGLAPAAIRNAVVAGEVSVVSSHGGLNFYIGNSERATGFYTTVPGVTPAIVGQEKDTRRVAEQALGRPVTDAEASSYFFDRAWSWMVEHPLQAAGLLARKFYYVFNAQHVALPHSYPFYAHDASTALRFYVIGPWLLIPLGLAGLLLAPTRGSRRDYLLWLSFVPAYAASVALFFVAERYRLPLLVPLCVGAGAALGTLAPWGSGLESRHTRGSGLQNRKRRGLAPEASVSRPDPIGWPVSRPDPRWRVAAAAAVLAVAANWPLKVSDGRWDEGLRLAQIYVVLKQYDNANRWVERLEGTKPPRPGAAHYGVGTQLLVANEAERARVHLEAAQRKDPGEPRVAYALGQALLRTGRAAEAIPHLRRGFESGQEIPRGGYDLAEALHATGDLAGAAVIVNRIRLPETEDVETWLRLGRIAQQARQPAVAEPYFRHAVVMRPALASARQQYGLNLLELGRLEEAARELREALRLDPRDSDSLSALAYCEVKMGRVDNARAYAAAALAINPRDPLAGGILRGGGS